MPTSTYCGMTDFKCSRYMQGTSSVALQVLYEGSQVLQFLLPLQ